MGEVVSGRSDLLVDGVSDNRNVGDQQQEDEGQDAVVGVEIQHERGTEDRQALDPQQHPR